MFLVEGPAGIGKSRLLAEFAGLARGHRVLAVAATEYDQPTPHYLIQDIADHLRDRAGSRPAEAGPVLGSDPRESARALRQWLRSEPTVLVVDDAHWADAASLRVLGLLIRQLPESVRVVLAYREGQFPDALAAALRAPGVEVRHLAVPPLADDESGALLPEVPAARRKLLVEAAHGNPLYLQVLADLAPDEFEATLRSGPPAPSRADRRAPARADQSALDRTIRAELAQLPAPERLAAQALAVCGATTDTELLCATADVTGAELDRAIDELTRRGWTTVHGGTVDFRHPLIRTAAYRLAPPAWRAAAHARAAAILRAAGAPPALRARHLEHALGTHDDAAATDLISAAAQTLSTAPATSARWAEAALRATPDRPTTTRHTAQLLLGHALLLSGSVERARDILEPLLPHPDPTPAAELGTPQPGDARLRPTTAGSPADPAAENAVATDHRQVIAATPTGSPGAEAKPPAPAGSKSPNAPHPDAPRPPGTPHSCSPATHCCAADFGGVSADSGVAVEAVLVYARCERILGRVDSARNLLACGIDRLGEDRNGSARLELAILEIQDNRDAEAARRVRALFETGAVRDPAIHAAAVTLRSMGQLNGLDLRGATADYRVAEREFGQLTDTRLLDGIHAVAALGWMSYFLDDQRTGLVHVERAIRVSRERGRSFILPELYTVRAYALGKLGRYEEALAAAEDALETAALYGYPGIAPLAGAIKLRVMEDISPREEVLHWWRTLDALPRPAMRWWRGVVEAALTEIAARQGWSLPCGTAVARVAARDPAPRAHPMLAAELAVAAITAVAQGELEAASALLSEAERAAEALGLPGQRAAAARARAEYLRARGDLDGAARAAEAAVAAYGQADMPLFRAQAVLITAEIAGLRGDFSAATARITAAREEFAAAGAQRLLESATAAQRRLAGRRTVSGATTLSAREREVADLAAQGLSNRDIADRLYVSPRTVEDHLGRILRKLGIPGRAGIAHRLAELDRPAG